jgi:hypothetical protein
MSSKWNNQQAAEAAFSAILEDPDASKPFDASWADKVAKSIDGQRKTLNAVILASVIPTGFLALSVLGIYVNIKFLGLEITNRSVLFEAALLATCLFGVFGAYVSILAAQSDQLLQVWVRKKHPTTALFYRLAFGPPFFRSPPFADPPGNPPPTAATKWIKASGRGLFYLVAVLISIGPMLVQIAAIREAFVGSICLLEADGLRPACEARAFWVAILASILTAANVLAYFIYALPLRYERRKAR